MSRSNKRFTRCYSSFLACSLRQSKVKNGKWFALDTISHRTLRDYCYPLVSKEQEKGKNTEPLRSATRYHWINDDRSGRCHSHQGVMTQRQEDVSSYDPWFIYRDRA